LDLTCVQLAVKFSTAKVSTAIVSQNLFLKTTFDVIGYFVARMPRRPGRERRGDPCLTNESTRFRRPIARRIERIGFLFEANEFTGQIIYGPVNNTYEYDFEKLPHLCPT
jgi:hypothetical protein